jgi:tRNA(adenine34) deaminase
MTTRADRLEQWMAHALDLARYAAAQGEVPVGAVVIHDELVIGRGYNRRESTQDPLAHAELLALAEAARTLGTWRLERCSLVVTLEPCPMCAGALVNARLEQLIYGCADPKAGAVRTLFCLCEDPRLNHRLLVTAGVRQPECSKILSDFFAQLRLERRAGS